MADNINLDFMNKESIKKWLIQIHEKYYIELKKANELPAAFWDSYSAFSNTEGGWIILGVSEGDPENEIIGVGNAERIQTVLWDQLSNMTKVSYRTVDNEDVSIHDLDGKKVIIVHVHEAPESKKPVYIGGKLDQAWVRTGDGDRKATKDDIASFMRNAQPGQDNLPAENFTMDDLDLDSVLSFKERIHKRYPQKNYLEMKNEDFLIEIGACSRNRVNNKLIVKRGTILFFGKCNSIKELYVHYHVDFFNRSGNNPRWSDRVTDDEPNEYEMNLYNFYRIVDEKIKNIIQNSFVMEEGTQIRMPILNFDETLRECLVNCIAHADYVQGYPSTKIEAYDGWFRFVNPGKMLVSPKQFFLGGDSRPRNEIIMKLFRFLGASERQGLGGPLIYKTALQNDFRRPEIISDIEHTELRVWNIDLADSYPELSNDEKNIFRYITKSNLPQSINAIRSTLEISEYRVRKGIQTLEEKGLVVKMGNGPSTKYRIGMESVEFLTQLQIAMETLKKQMV